MGFFIPGKLARAPTLPLPLEDHKTETPFHEQRQPREYFVPAATPAPYQQPGPDVPTDTTLNPTDAYIVDFFFDKVEEPHHNGGGGGTSEQHQHHKHHVAAPFSRDEIINSAHKPGELMDKWYATNSNRNKNATKNGSRNIDFTERKRDLRWIHIPWNSMRDVEKLMQKVCVDIGLTKDAAMGSILSNDKWDDSLHNMNDTDQQRLWTSYMQTSCLEISLAKKHLESQRLIAEAEAGKSKLIHRGANMALFIPFIHWGTKGVLKWRTDWVEKTKAELTPVNPTDWPPTKEKLAAFAPRDQSQTDGNKNFYVNLMAEQLLDPTKPLHLRRTLDQWYYSTTCDTSKTRDNDQVVSKFGPKTKDGRKILRHEKAILAVDQLWLWMLGGDTVITCFDRRWEKDKTYQCNILDKMIQWTLPQRAAEVKSGYDLVHLLLNEISGFFFNYSSTLDPAIRFHEIFRKAISDLNNQQAKRFQLLADLSKAGPIWLQKDRELDEMFNLKDEFKIVQHIRDVIDELGMIGKIYDEQSSILDALADFQYYDALFREGYTDEGGNAKKIPKTTSGEHKEGSKAVGDENAEPEQEEAEETMEAKDEPEPETKSVSSAVPVNWDERDWFRRTKRMLYKYRGIVGEMMVEATEISDSLQNTINLKQNSGSLYEAHASRKEAEMIMVFTFVSSVILPLSFFTSVFGMNVAELNDEENPVTLKVAMAYIVPLSALLVLIFLYSAFKSRLPEFMERAGNLLEKRKKEKNATKGSEQQQTGDHAGDGGMLSEDIEDGDTDGQRAQQGPSGEDGEEERRSAARRRWWFPGKREEVKQMEEAKK